MKTKLIEEKVYIMVEIRRKIKPIKRDIEKYYGIIKAKKHIPPEELDKKMREETRSLMMNEIH